MFLFLSETKQSFDFVKDFQFHYSYRYLHTIDPIGRSGGLALFYSKDFPITILYSSNRIIDIETSYNGKTFLYLLYTGIQYRNFEIRFGKDLHV